MSEFKVLPVYPTEDMQQAAINAPVPLVAVDSMSRRLRLDFAVRYEAAVTEFLQSEKENPTKSSQEQHELDRMEIRKLRNRLREEQERHTLFRDTVGDLGNRFDRMHKEVDSRYVAEQIFDLL